MIDNVTNVIFENYNRYLSGNNDRVATSMNALNMIASDGSFNAYIETLVDGLDPYQRNTIKAVCERQREMLLQEHSGQIGSSSFALGYAVTYFPILADIYSDPILSKIATVYPLNKSITTVPRVEIIATVYNTDGTTKEYKMPRAQYLIRSGSENLKLIPNVSNNLFEMSAGYPNQVNRQLARINKRYFMLRNANLTLKDTTNTNTEEVIDVAINLRADARGQTQKQFTFQDQAGNEITANLIGHINWDSGLHQYSMTFDNIPNGVELTCNYLDSRVFYSPDTGDVGRVKVSTRMRGWDIDVDTKEEFEIDLTAESIQDYKDIYNIDLVRSMSEAIKHQMMFNKDHDLAYFLESTHPELKDNGACQLLDLTGYNTSGGMMNPRNIRDILTAIGPRIAMINTVVFRNFRAEPQYIVTGLRTGALLKSMQNFTSNLTNTNNGTAGFVGSQASSFGRQEILVSPAVSDSHIYSVYKAPNDKLSTSVIIDFIYKPIYIIEEITNSQKRTYVKSRTAIEICDTRALGVLEIKGMDNIVGPDYNNARNIMNESL